MISIRAAKIDDVSMISLIHAYCWRETYAFMPEAVLRSRSREFREQQWLNWFDSHEESDALFVIEADQKVVGFCFCCRNRDPEIDGRGELHAAYVLPDYRGRETGPVMMLTMVDFLAEQGLTPPVLWAFRDNPIRFWYAQMGWRSQIKRDRVIEGRRLPEVGYVCDDCDKLRQRLQRLVTRYSSEAALTQIPQHSQMLGRQKFPNQIAVSPGNNRKATEMNQQTPQGLL
ncbi:GNAT family N-acetyltransferase [Thalassospira alkalitolerans]|uniref:GNAT family N-acetyltransferase n=1 Tax=Thalassospira alkalitolerans TaxID=1293890 RepID=UPI0030EC906B|tara:strand:- start:16694 stop:17380 length:687 start_codon:yes stop_codon:yes gene_type:complete